MKRLLALSLVVFAFSGPAMAANGCATSPSTAWQPQTKLDSMLKTEGLTVSKVKVENGCYEVYVKDAKGKRFNRAYNAETLKLLSNAEAGEG